MFEFKLAFHDPEVVEGIHGRQPLAADLVSAGNQCVREVGLRDGIAQLTGLDDRPNLFVVKAMTIFAAQ
jgi:hypothetical protein